MVRSSIAALSRLGQRHDELVALGARLELAARAAGDREDRLRRPRAPPSSAASMPAGVADADAQLVRAGVEPAHACRPRRAGRAAGRAGRARGPRAARHRRRRVCTSTSTCAPPRRSSPRLTRPDGRQPGQPAIVRLHLRASARRRARPRRGRRWPARPGRRRRSGSDDQDADQAEPRTRALLPERKVAASMRRCPPARRPRGAARPPQASAGSVLLTTWLMVERTTRTLTFGASSTSTSLCRRPWSPCRSARRR